MLLLYCIREVQADIGSFFRWMCLFFRYSSRQDSRKGQKLLIRLEALGHKFPIPEQGVSRHRRRHILRRFFICDMSDFQRDIALPGSFLHPRHPIIGKRALVGVIEDKTGLLYMRMFCTFLKPRRLRFWSKGQVLERDAAV